MKNKNKKHLLIKLFFVIIHLSGIALISIGAFLIFVPAGYISAGILLIIPLWFGKAKNE